MEFKQYSGNGKPFIYAAFVLEDQTSVLPILENLYSHGNEIWQSQTFDKRRIRKAALVILFLSPVASENQDINKIIQYIAQAGKPVLAIHLLPTTLTPAQRLMLNSLQGVLRYDCVNDNAFYDKLYGAAVLQNLQVTQAQRNAASRSTWGLSAGILAAVASAIFFALNAGGTIDPASVLADLGYSGRMNEISEVWVYGDTNMDRCCEKALPRTFPHENNQGPSILIDNGMKECNQGVINSISDFSQLKNLKKLALVGNQVTDFTPIFSLKKLAYLDLTANPVSDLTGIGEMSALKTLYIDYTNIKDLTPLNECKTLKTVYVDEAQYTAYVGDAKNLSFKLIVVGPSEEINSLYCHIFGGVEEYDSPVPGRYGVYIESKSSNVYRRYEYQVLMNGVPLKVDNIRYTDVNGDGINDKTDLDIDLTAMTTYDPTAEYTLVVTYESYSAIYQIWHKNDKNSRYAREGNLIEKAN
jgi:hypothetical protein